MKCNDCTRCSIIGGCRFCILRREGSYATMAPVRRMNGSRWCQNHSAAFPDPLPRPVVSAPEPHVIVHGIGTGGRQARKVSCEDADGNVSSFRSMAEAIEKLDVGYYGIRLSLKTGNAVDGYRWRYV